LNNENTGQIQSLPLGAALYVGIALFFCCFYLVGFTQILMKGVRCYFVGLLRGGYRYKEKRIYGYFRRAKSRSSKTRCLQRSAAESLNSAKAIGSDIAHVILRILASSGQKSLWLQIITG